VGARGFDLKSTESVLTKTREDLRTTDRALSAASNCSYATLAAWFETLSASWDTTGRALGRAVYARMCRAARIAYRNVDGSSGGIGAL
jgi:hypothetical protein